MSKQPRQPHPSAGRALGGVVLTATAALVACAAARAWQRNRQTPLAEEPIWCSLQGPVTGLENGCLWVGEDEQTVRVAVGEAALLDAVTGQPLSQPPESGRVLVVYDATAPVTMSLPPLYGGATLILACPAGGEATLARFDAQGRDGELTLTPLTPVSDLTGAPCRETEGVVCAVLWEPSPAGPVVRRAIPLLVADETMVPLRARAEALGYQVTWRGAEAPIVLTREGIRLELWLDSDRFVYSHPTRDIHPLDQMEHLSQPLRLEGRTTLAPASLIAALV